MHRRERALRALGRRHLADHTPRLRVHVDPVQRLGGDTDRLALVVEGPRVPGAIPRVRVHRRRHLAYVAAEALGLVGTLELVGELGEIDEVAGDDNEDIFDGLAVATSALAKPVYVPAEQVGEITEGVVHLSLTEEQFGQLGEFLEPASSETIEPNSKGGIGESLGAELREVEGKVLAPTQRHEHSMNIWRRIAFYFKRRAG